MLIRIFNNHVVRYVFISGVILAISIPVAIKILTFENSFQTCINMCMDDSINRNIKGLSERKETCWNSCRPHDDVTVRNFFNDTLDVE